MGNRLDVQDNQDNQYVKDVYGASQVDWGMERLLVIDEVLKEEVDSFMFTGKKIFCNI